MQRSVSGLSRSLFLNYPDWLRALKDWVTHQRYFLASFILNVQRMRADH